MSFFTSIWRFAMIGLAKLPGLVIWLFATSLTIFLVYDFTEGQSHVIMGIAMLSILIGSFGLLYARSAWRSGAKPEAIGGLVSWLLASALLLFLELGFWSSSVSLSHQQYLDREDAKKGVATIIERDRRALASGEIPESAAEIKAKMDEQLSRRIGNLSLGRLTSDCFNTRAPDFPACKEYLALKALHAKAEQAERIEKRVWNAGTRTEVANVKRNLFAGADWMSKNIGGEADSWAFAITVLFVAILWLARDGSLVITFAPAKPREAPGRPEASPAPSQPEDRKQAPAPAPEPVERPQASSKPEGPVLPPTPPEVDVTAFIAALDAPAPEVAPLIEQKQAWEPEADKRVVKPKTGYPPRPVDEDPRFSKKNSLVGSVEMWARHCLKESPEKTSGGHFRFVTKSSEAWASYLDFTQKMGYTPVKSQSAFGKKLAKMGVKREARVDGSHHPGYRLEPFAVEKVA